jgi:hypothetical protein
MPEDLRLILGRLLAAGDIKTATVTVVLKPPAPSPDPDQGPSVCTIDFGPVSSKE